MIAFLRKHFGTGIPPDEDDCHDDLACETEKRLRALACEQDAFEREVQRSDPVDVARALMTARDRVRRP